MQINQWLTLNTAALKTGGIPSARLDCLLLLEHVLQKDRAWILAHDEQELKAHEHTKLGAFISRRKKGEPVAYITATKEFYGHNFYVDENVLIPRPESEAIIDLLKAIATKQDINTVVDIGTGSGCLAICAALELPNIHITACDVSEGALSVARKNARNHGVRIRFHLSDLFEDLPGMPATRPHVVLANLPYVPNNLVTSAEITKEPAQALFSGNDGLNTYRRFWAALKTRKNPPFAVITESLTTQHSGMQVLATDAGYRCIETTGLVQQFNLGSPLQA